MAVDDLMTNILFFMRWIHIISGVTWIGLLYFFNFVNVPFQGVLEKELKPKVNPALLGRALFWFRWGAMSTFLFGWLLLLAKYGHGGGALFFDETGAISGRAIWILYGGILGSIMWFNVWFIIWPAQKRILRWVKEGQAPSEMPALVKRAGLASRTNTYLSAPMLFGMIAPNNYGAFSWMTLIIVTLVGVAIIYHVIKVSGKVGQTV